MLDLLLRLEAKVNIERVLEKMENLEEKKVRKQIKAVLKLHGLLPEKAKKSSKPKKPSAHRKNS